MNDIGSNGKARMGLNRRKSVGDLNHRILSDAGLALGFQSTDDFMKFIAQRIQQKYQNLINNKDDLTPPNLRPEAV